MRTRGRPRKPDEEKRVCIGISMDPQTMKMLEWLSKNLEMRPSTAIKYLIQQAGKDQTLRNIIKNSEVADLKAKGKVAWEVTSKTGYVTFRKKDGTLFTKYIDPKKTVDQQKNNNTENQENIPNEEIDREIQELYANKESQEPEEETKPTPKPYDEEKWKERNRIYFAQHPELDPNNKEEWLF